MNPVTLIVSLAVLIGIASAQVISPPVAPYFGPLGPMYPGAVAALGGLGLGLGGMGIAGLASMAAFGPLGPFGPLGGLGFGLGSFGPLGNARLGGIRGRRALDENLHGRKIVHGDIKCELTASLLNCTGPHEIIQCEIESFTKVPIEIGHFKVNDFVIREKVINKVESLKIMPKKVSGRVGHKLERLAIFDNVKLAKSESGFYVKDAACFSDVLAIVKELPDKIKLTLTDSIVSN